MDEPQLPGRPLRQWYCADYGLSMFQSEDQARARFTFLEERFGNARKRYGDHLAAVKLQPAHGARTRTNENGHFDVYEYIGTDLSKCATPVGPL
jgi:hypothetical protein